jgi:hypothetical protein
MFVKCLRAYPQDVIVSPKLKLGLLPFKIVRLPLILLDDVIVKLRRIGRVPCARVGPPRMKERWSNRVSQLASALLM